MSWIEEEVAVPRSEALARVRDANRDMAEEADRSFGFAAIGATSFAAFALLTWLLGAGDGWLIPASVAGLLLALALQHLTVRDRLNRAAQTTMEALPEAGLGQPDGQLPSTRFEISEAHPTVFAWSPSGRLGAITLPKRPSQALTPEQYRAALAKRIDGLVCNETAASARHLLTQIERYDWNINAIGVASVGTAMVEGSNYLHEQVDFPSQPIPTAELEHDADLAAHLEDGDSLEAFVNELYPFRDDW